METGKTVKRAGMGGEGDTKKHKQAAAAGNFESNKRH